jgi:hypothetical protein
MIRSCPDAVVGCSLWPPLPGATLLTPLGSSATSAMASGRVCGGAGSCRVKHSPRARATQGEAFASRARACVVAAPLDVHCAAVINARFSGNRRRHKFVGSFGRAGSNLRQESSLRAVCNPAASYHAQRGIALRERPAGSFPPQEPPPLADRCLCARVYKERDDVRVVEPAATDLQPVVRAQIRAWARRLPTIRSFRSAR